MMFLFLAILFIGILYLIDKSMKDGMVFWLKYGLAAFIVILAFTDIYFMLETQRWIDVCRADVTGHCQGTAYSYTFLNGSNVSVTHTTTLYGEYSSNTGSIIAYHEADRWAMEDIVGMLPYIAIFIASTFGLQFVYNIYYNSQYGKPEEPMR